VKTKIVCHPGPNADNSGFALAELLLVLGLMGIMAGGAVPGVHRMQREWELWGGTRLVESSLLWARTHAISANESLVFIIDEGGRRIYWTAADGSRFENTLRRLPAGVSITGAPKKPLRFYQHGNAVPAGTFVIQSSVGTYRVIVSVMGRIRVVRDP
jgi:Tfp pilus assembly protein FimT